MTVRINSVLGLVTSLLLRLTTSTVFGQNCEVKFAGQAGRFAEKTILCSDGVLNADRLAALAKLCAKAPGEFCFLNIQTSREDIARQSSATDTTCRGRISQLNGSDLRFRPAAQVFARRPVGSVFKIRTTETEVDTIAPNGDFTVLDSPAGRCELKFLSIYRREPNIFVVCASVDRPAVDAVARWVRSWEPHQPMTVEVGVTPFFLDYTNFPWLPPLLTKPEATRIVSGPSDCTSTTCHLRTGQKECSNLSQW